MLLVHMLAVFGTAMAAVMPSDAVDIEENGQRRRPVMPSYPPRRKGPPGSGCVDWSPPVPMPGKPSRVYINYNDDEELFFLTDKVFGTTIVDKSGGGLHRKMTLRISNGSPRPHTVVVSLFRSFPDNQLPDQGLLDHAKPERSIVLQVPAVWSKNGLAQVCFEIPEQYIIEDRGMAVYLLK